MWKRDWERGRESNFRKEAILKKEIGNKEGEVVGLKTKQSWTKRWWLDEGESEIHFLPYRLF